MITFVERTPPGNPLLGTVKFDVDGDCDVDQDDVARVQAYSTGMSSCVDGLDVLEFCVCP